jgi:hypothetical protein
MSETNARDAAPSAALKGIGGALVGTWKLSGGAEGVIRYEWMEGGRFLVQHADLKAFGRQIKGIEAIGNLHRVGEQPSEDVWTRFYSFLDGLTLDYVYELRGKELTISPALRLPENGCGSASGPLSLTTVECKLR